MDRGRIRALGTPGELKEQVRAQDPAQSDPSLDDVFRHFSGRGLSRGEASEGDFNDVRRTRRTAGRVG